MSHKDEGLKTRHRQYWKKIEADSVVLDPGIIAISWEDSTIRLHDGYTIGGRIFPMAPAPSLTVNVLTPLSGNGSVSSPISLNIAALANQVPVLANAPIIGQGVTGNPLDLDLVALAALLANTVPVAHDATLVGTGVVGAPLSVNWGLAPQQPVSHNGTLSGAGTVANPLAVVPAALASLVSVSAISPITGDGKVATPLSLDVAALLPQLHNNVAVATDGVTITGSGTTANPLVAVPTIPVVVTSAPITGNGTLANPIDINIVSAIAEIAAAGGVPAAHDASLTGNGTTAIPLSVNWANMPALNVQHDGSMTGQGTAGNPLSVNWSAQPSINVQHDGTMTGSGTTGSPLSVNPIALANQVPVTVSAGLSGNGTIGSPLAPNVGVLGPMLSGLVPVAVSAPLTGIGTGVLPLGITNATGAARGVVQLATASEGFQPANDSDAVTPAYIAAAVAELVLKTSGPLADPRPNVNPTYRVVGTDTATSTGYTFAVAQQSDIFGAGVAGQESGPQKLLTVDSMSALMRTDEVNDIYGIGAHAARDATGNDVSASGFAAGIYNTGNYVSLGGYQAGYKNAGSYVSANGQYSAVYNTGDYTSSFGYSAAYNNTGNRLFASGNAAASFNSGVFVSAVGYNSAYKNMGSFVDAFGSYTATANTGSHAVLVGEYAGMHNRGDNVTHVGNTAGYHPLIVSEPGLTITQISPTSVSLSSPTAAAIGSTVVLYGGSGPILHLANSDTPMVVTSATVLTVPPGYTSPYRLLDPGVNTGASIRQAPAWDNIATFGNNAQATGPNQAVLGGPSQTPCGWAPFLVISDERDKIFLRDEMKSGKAAKGAAPAFELTPEIALDFVSRQLPGAFRYDHRDRYNTLVEVAVEVAETEAKTKAERKAERKAGGAVGAPALSDAVREKATRFETVVEKQDGSRADDHYTIGYSAQQLLKAAEAAGIPSEFSGVRDMNEHGNDKLLLDATANVAFLTLAVQALLARIQKLEGSK